MSALDEPCHVVRGSQAVALRALQARAFPDAPEGVFQLRAGPQLTLGDLLAGGSPSLIFAGQAAAIDLRDPGHRSWVGAHAARTPAPAGLGTRLSMALALHGFHHFDDLAGFHRAGADAHLQAFSELDPAGQSSCLHHARLFAAGPGARQIAVAPGGAAWQRQDAGLPSAVCSGSAVAVSAGGFCAAALGGNGSLLAAAEACGAAKAAEILAAHGQRVGGRLAVTNLPTPALHHKAGAGPCRPLLNAAGPGPAIAVPLAPGAAAPAPEAWQHVIPGGLCRPDLPAVSGRSAGERRQGLAVPASPYRQGVPA